MINYTDHLFLLMKDIVARVPTLSFIDMKRVLALRAGRTTAEGTRATASACRQASPVTTGAIATRVTSTRRSEWFVTKSPRVHVEGDSIDYMGRLRCRVSAIRCWRAAASSFTTRDSQTGWPSWTRSSTSCITSIRSVPAFDAWSARMATIRRTRHGDRFFTNVVEMVNQYSIQPIQVRFPAA